MAQPLGSEVRPGPSSRERSILVAVALGPVALATFLLVASPAFQEPLWDNRVAVAGYPLGLLLIALFAGLTATAVLVALRVRSTLVAAMVTTLIASSALYLVILAPAIVLIVIGLGST